MRILKSGFITLAAGALTVLLAIAARAGIEAAGYNLNSMMMAGGSIGQFMIAGVSSVVIMGLFEFLYWRPRRRIVVRQKRRINYRNHHAAIPLLCVGIIIMAASIFTSSRFPATANWWIALTIGGTLAAASMVLNHWLIADAGRDITPGAGHGWTTQNGAMRLILALIRIVTVGLAMLGLSSLGYIMILWLNLENDNSFFAYYLLGAMFTVVSLFVLLNDKPTMKRPPSINTVRFLRALLFPALVLAPFVAASVWLARYVIIATVTNDNIPYLLSFALSGSIASMIGLTLVE